MRVQFFFMSILTLPVSAAAHSGQHVGNKINGIAHLLKQHYSQGLAAPVLISVSLLAVCTSAHDAEPTNH